MSVDNLPEHVKQAARQAVGRESLNNAAQWPAYADETYRDPTVGNGYSITPDPSHIDFDAVGKCMGIGEIMPGAVAGALDAAKKSGIGGALKGIGVAAFVDATYCALNTPSTQDAAPKVRRGYGR